jgi:Lrp/AsnC family transcriptional regulator for asnA, asnC and gidA
MVDSVDIRIINVLMNDADQSSEVVARQLGINSSTVRRRIKRLTNDGTLRIMAVPDPVQIGYSLRVILSFNVIYEKATSTLEALASQPEIKWVSATTGRFNIMALGWFVSTQAFSTFMAREVGKLKGIKNAETFVFLPSKKYL